MVSILALAGKRIPAAFGLLLLFACASEMPKAGAPIALDGDKVLVFGKIDFIENGRSKIPYKKGATVLFMTTTQPIKPAVGGLLSTDRDGYFYQVLPKDQYELYVTGISGWRGMVCTRMQFPGPPASAVYLGTLTADVETTIGQFWNTYVVRLHRVEVLDELESASAALLARYPDVKGQHIIKGLLRRTPGYLPRIVAAGYC